MGSTIWFTSDAVRCYTPRGLPVTGVRLSADNLRGLFEAGEVLAREEVVHVRDAANVRSWAAGYPKSPTNATYPKLSWGCAAMARNPRDATLPAALTA